MRIRARIESDPHPQQSVKLDQDPDQYQRQKPDPHQSEKPDRIYAVRIRCNANF
jgi:hypothetical protein